MHVLRNAKLYGKVLQVFTLATVTDNFDLGAQALRQHCHCL